MLISDYRLRSNSTGAQAIAALRQQAGRDLPALLVTGDTAPARFT
jgi:CheY-like chemotaxis protein